MFEDGLIGIFLYIYVDSALKNDVYVVRLKKYMLPVNHLNICVDFCPYLETLSHNYGEPMVICFFNCKTVNVRRKGRGGKGIFIRSRKYKDVNARLCTYT